MGQYLPLPFGKFTEVGVLLAGTWADRSGQDVHQFRADGGLAAGGFDDVVHQRFRFQVFQQVTVCAFAKCGDHIQLAVGYGEQQNAAVHTGITHGANGVDAVHIGHVQVQQDQVRLQLLCQVQGFPAIAGFGDGDNAVLQLQ